MKMADRAAWSFQEWLAFIEQQSPIEEIELGLARIRAVAEKMDLLCPSYFLFTVAGTNGKGTTSRALEQLLIAEQARVGVYSSPHLFHYRERVRIQDQSPQDHEFVEAFCAIEAQRDDVFLTYFEYTTLAALYLFQKADLNAVILEVGLGGRLDATNILNANIAIITTIDIDHVDYLGTTREAIGFEKAGIFKPNHQIGVVADQNVPLSILEQAQKNQVQLYCTQPNFEQKSAIYSDLMQHLAQGFFDWSRDQTQWQLTGNGALTPLNLSALPLPQIPLQNAAAALTALFLSPFKMDLSTLHAVLPQLALIGRFQKLQSQPDLFVDVAHNPHAAHYLTHRVKQQLKTQDYAKIHLIVGMLKDKDIENTLKQFAPLQRLLPVEWHFATLSPPRGANVLDLATASALQNGFTCHDSVKAALHHVQLRSQCNDLILVCGSFHTVSETFLCLI